MSQVTTTYLCSICGDCDGTMPHTYEDFHASFREWWDKTWPEIWAYEGDRMTNIDAILQRILLRGAIADTMCSNLFWEGE